MFLVVIENVSKFSIGIFRLFVNELEGVVCFWCCKFRWKVCCLYVRINFVFCLLNVLNIIDFSRFVCVIM